MALLKKAANEEGNSESMSDRSALPAGKVLAHIVKSEMKATKKKNGHYLNVHFKVIEPEGLAGRMFFTNLNLDNPNPVAVEIATKELNSICQACGKQGVTDSEEVHQIPMVVDLGIEAATAQFPESNNIKSYAPEDDWDGGESGAPDVAVEETSGESSEDGLPWDEEDQA